jgi:hypothetical protein
MFLVRVKSWLLLASILSWDERVRELVQIPSFHENSHGVDLIILLGIYISIILKLR